MIIRRSLGLLLASFTSAGVIVISCRDGTGPDSGDFVRVDPGWVSGEAALALDTATGQFRLTYPPPNYVGLTSAETTAVGIARLSGNPNEVGNAVEVLQRDRGGPIDFNRLQVCERAVYSVSPYGEFPDTVPIQIRRAWSSRWAVALCGVDGAAQLSVDVPDERPEPDLAFGGLNLAGVPYRYPSGLPVTPEQAVAALVKAAKGRTVITAPTAYEQWDSRGAGELAFCASWRLRLDAPVVVENVSTGATRLAQEFFVKHVPACFVDEIALFVAAESQPSTRWLLFFRRSSDAASSFELDSVQVPLTGPAAFERVRIRTN